jgi:NAD(P)-dependent dehydrogenase (short-subunit alcohol dehydrogenase family)
MPKSETPKALTILVAGGAGFVGSHLCERLIDDGAVVYCVDNLQTGARDNLRRLDGQGRFSFVQADIVLPLPARLMKVRFDRIYNLACAASPPLYQADPEHTMLTSVVGTDQLLKLAERDGARLLQASTSEVYGDPLAHPSRNPTGATSTARALGPATTRASGRPRRCASTSSGRDAPRFGWRASSTPTGPGCRPMTVASSPTWSARHWAVRTSRCSATARRPGRSATCPIWSTAWSS